MTDGVAKDNRSDPLRCRRCHRSLRGRQGVLAGHKVRRSLRMVEVVL